MYVYHRTADLAAVYYLIQIQCFIEMFQYFLKT